MKSIIIIVISFMSCNLLPSSIDPSIGGVYLICSPRPYPKDDKNPFDKSPQYSQRRATVLITDKRNGYVQYIWAHDSLRNDPIRYSRSIAEFNQLIDFCK